jgi:hypothetical protein
VTRHDVANLVIRTFALWLGVTGLATLAGLLSVTQMPGQPEPHLTSLIFAIPLAAGVVLWLVAPKLARAAFDRSDDTVPYGITRDDLPPLACFVVGLVVLAGAVPQAASWIAMQMMIGQQDGLMNPDFLPQLNQQSAGTAAEIVARLIVGAVLIVISRRRGIWAAPSVDADDARPADD